MEKSLHKVKLRLTFDVEIESYEYDEVETIADELYTDLEYEFKDTDNLRVITSEFVDIDVREFV